MNTTAFPRKTLWRSILALMLVVSMLASASVMCFASTTATQATQATEGETAAGTTAPTNLNGLWIDYADTSWYNDTDTVFYLSDAAELAGLAKLVSTNATKTGTYMSGYTFYITADIDLSGHHWTFGKGTSGSGNTATPFCGTIIGAKGASATNPYVEGVTERITIRNMASTYSNTNYVGFVSTQAGGGVQNINFDTVYFTGAGAVGVVVGIAQAATGEAAPVYKNITINNATISATAFNVGGFMGNSLKVDASFVDCSIRNSVVESSQNTKKLINLGGFIGKVYTGTFTNCDVDNVKVNSTGTISTVNDRAIGGFHGGETATAKTIYNNCDVNVDITLASVGNVVGGFYGFTSGKGAKLTNCTTSGSITVPQGSTYIGGIAGSLTLSDLENVTSTMTLKFTGESATGSALIGGIAGCVYSTVSFKDCTFAGTIEGLKSRDQVGSLVGGMTYKETNGVLTMENCTVTKETNYNWFGVDTKDYDITLKNGDVSVVYDTLKVNYQKNTNDTNALRLIATVNGDAMTNYQKVGFKLTNSEGKVATLWTQTVYQKITANGTPVTPSDKGYGASSTYFFAVNLAGVPTNETFTVQAFVETLDHVIVAGEVFNCCLANLT